MNLWVPPMWLRRAFHVLWLPVVIVLTAVLVPFYVVGAVMAVFPRRRRLLRVVSFAMAYLWTDVAMLFGCWALWFVQPLSGRDVTRWRERHTALLRIALRVLAKASRSMVGFRVVVDAGPLPPPHHPLVILGRHAGPGDSFTLVNLILTTFRRRPKVVLKAAMQWDPGIDVLLNRLDCYFVPSVTGAGDDRIKNVARLAGSLQRDEALLIFPEGGNWTPKRHERAVRYLLRTGQYERAKEALEEEHVLPPRPGGVAAALSARPDVDVVVLAHAGLDLLVTPLEIWDAIPVDHRPMSIHWWVAEAGTIPADVKGIGQWLDDIWGEVDAWVEDELSQAATPAPPAP